MRRNSGKEVSGQRDQAAASPDRIYKPCKEHQRTYNQKHMQ